MLNYEKCVDKLKIIHDWLYHGLEIRYADKEFENQLRQCITFVRLQIRGIYKGTMYAERFWALSTSSKVKDMNFTKAYDDLISIKNFFEVEDIKKVENAHRKAPSIEKIIQKLQDIDYLIFEEFDANQELPF